MPRSVIAPSNTRLVLRDLSRPSLKHSWVVLLLPFCLWSTVWHQSQAECEIQANVQQQQ